MLREAAFWAGVLAFTVGLFVGCALGAWLERRTLHREWQRVRFAALALKAAQKGG